jgi:hypothetical protein
MTCKHQEMAKKIVLSTLITLFLWGCESGSLANKEDGSGGSVTVSGGTLVTSGGSISSGGLTSVGGTVVSGGTIAGGGVIVAGGHTSSGGNPVLGGSVSSGGTMSSGGNQITGGTVASGGAQTTGGTSAAGGTISTGGTASTGGSACVPIATTAMLKKEHNAGKACIACHKSDGEAGTLAGTVFAATGNTPVPGATVTITQNNGQVLNLVTAKNGNFYTDSPISFPAKVQVSKCPETKLMIATITNGDCNSCHNSNMPLRLP